jgi:hypothetical protein
MTNPLIDKFEEIYGKKEPEPEPEPKQEEKKKDSLIDDKITGYLTNIIPAKYNVANPNTLSWGSSISSSLASQQTCFVFPNTNVIESQFCSIMKLVGDKKAIVSSINVDMDTFNEYGRQIKFSIEIIASHP